MNYSSVDMISEICLKMSSVNSNSQSRSYIFNACDARSVSSLILTQRINLCLYVDYKLAKTQCEFLLFHLEKELHKVDKLAC